MSSYQMRKMKSDALQSQGLEKQGNQYVPTAQKVQSAQDAERTRYNQMMADQRNSRNKDLAQGKARGQQIFSNLGRLDEGRNQDIQTVMAQRQANLNGFTPEEQNAMRDQNLSSALSGQQAALRQQKIALQQNGVRGGAASAAMAKMQKDNTNANTGMERDLFLKNIDAKRAGLDSYEKSAQTALAQEQATKQFNIQQAMKEKMGQLTTELGYGSLGQADRSSILNKLLGEKQVDAQTEIAKKDEK